MSRKTPKITVVGSANVDFIVQLPRLPARGETVAGGPFSQAFGGKGSNQAVAARRAGGEVSMVASLGGDALGRDFLELFHGEGIDVSQTRTHAGVPCGVALIQVDGNGDNTIAIAPGANELLSPEQVDAAEPIIAASNLVMLQMEIPDPALERVVEIAKRHKVMVMLNVAPCRPTRLKIDSRIDVLVVNETEAGLLAGLEVTDVHSAAEAAKKLGRTGGHMATLVTLGAKGCILYGIGVARPLPAYQVHAIDATAAGDTFCGAFAVALADEHNEGGIVAAVKYASAAGALSASRMGAIPSIPTREEILEFLQTHEPVKI